MLTALVARGAYFHEAACQTALCMSSCVSRLHGSAPQQTHA